MSNDDNKTTHFGFEEVPIHEKSNRVADVFRSVASHYDLMNDLMSLGMHRLWKRFMINRMGLRKGQSVLDVAAGTGDIAKACIEKVGVMGKVVVTDINEAMLSLARDRLCDAGKLRALHYVQADAEQLPFSDHSFDCVTIAFGLRNVTDKTAALRAMSRVLKPGGRLFVLEFSHPTSALFNKLYDFYSFNIIPTLGERITHDRDSYQYLVESIRKHPSQEELKNMMESAGFEDVCYSNLTGGVVALHIGYQY